MYSTLLAFQHQLPRINHAVQVA